LAEDHEFDIRKRKMIEQIPGIGPDAPVPHGSGVESYSHGASSALVPITCALNIYPVSSEILTEDMGHGLAPLGKEIIK
jgi:hypothetical protein